MTIGINTSPLAGKSGSRLTARQVKERLEQELVGNVSIRVLEQQSGPIRGRFRAVASCSCSARRGHAARGLRAHCRQAAGCGSRGGRPRLRAGRTALDRRSGGLPRCHHAAARPTQGPLGADGQPRHRLGAGRLPRPRADRLPHRVPDGDAWLGHPAFGLRALRALVRRDQVTATGEPRGRPPRGERPVRAAEAPGAWPALRRPGRRSTKAWWWGRTPAPRTST